MTTKRSSQTTSGNPKRAASNRTASKSAEALELGLLGLGLGIIIGEGLARRQKAPQKNPAVVNVIANQRREIARPLASASPLPESQMIVLPVGEPKPKPVDALPNVAIGLEPKAEPVGALPNAAISMVQSEPLLLADYGSETVSRLRIPPLKAAEAQNTPVVWADDGAETIARLRKTHLKPAQAPRRSRSFVIPALVVIVMVVGVYVLGDLLLPRYLSQWLATYVVRPALWLAIAGVSLLLWGWGGRLRAALRFGVVPAALLVGAAQVSVLVIAGVFLGFGTSPYDHSLFGSAINLAFFGAVLLGVEFSRAYLLTHLGGGKSVMAIALIALLFTAVTSPLLQLLGLTQGNPLQAIPFVGGELFPAFSENLLACYLAVVGGPLAAIAYRGVLELFVWFAPILPDLPWVTKALIGTALPIVGFLLIEAPMPSRESHPASQGQAKRSSAVSWLALSLTCLVILSFAMGLLPVHATLVGSGSMEPVMRVGDVAVIRKLSADQLGVGDVAQFKRANVTVLHRIVGIDESNGTKWYSTKGDNNPSVDSDLVASREIVGKIMFVVPQVGWLGVWARTPLGLGCLVGGPLGCLLILEAWRWQRRRQRTVKVIGQ